MPDDASTAKLNGTTFGVLFGLPFSSFIIYHSIRYQVSSFLRFREKKSPEMSRLTDSTQKYTDWTFFVTYILAVVMFGNGVLLYYILYGGVMS